MNTETHKKYNKSEKGRIRSRKYENRSEIIEKRRKYDESRKESRKQYFREYQKEYRKRADVQEYQKEYRERLEVKKRRKKYDKSPEEKERRKNRLAERRRDDHIYRLNKNMTGAIWKSLKHKKNGRHWEAVIGYTVNDLISHLEKQFKDGMNWDNYGEWHIDHIIPKSIHKDFNECWSLSNLQPLWAIENQKKSNLLINLDDKGPNKGMLF